MSMEMTSSIINNLWPLVWRQDLLPRINGGVIRLQFYWYGLLDLLCQVYFGVFLMVAPRRIILALFISAATFSIMMIRIFGSSVMSTKLFGLFSRILVLVLLSMLFNYFNGYARARRLIIVAQIKIWEHLNWYLQVYGIADIWYDMYVIIFRCLQNNTKLYYGRRRVWRPLRLTRFLLDLF
jgi:hypothetical protein